MSNVRANILVAAGNSHQDSLLTDWKNDPWHVSETEPQTCQPQYQMSNIASAVSGHGQTRDTTIHFDHLIISPAAEISSSSKLSINGMIVCSAPRFLSFFFRFSSLSCGQHRYQSHRTFRGNNPPVSDRLTPSETHTYHSIVP